ncbi:MAG: ABC transporter ATP-binding protein [Phycisphaeraceae bacterium]|nr:ABC transporter ATP-binding protein [Phycisphaeraceae bacterium]
MTAPAQEPHTTPSTGTHQQVGGAAHAPETVLSASGLRKTYLLGRVKVPVLHGVDFSLSRGEFVAVLGSSGSGKSTLLHLLGGLDSPDTHNGGTISYRGKNLRSLSSYALDRYRAREAGFVFQFYHLLPELTVLQNVAVAAMVRWGLGYFREKSRVLSQTRALLEEVGLGHRLEHLPSELSGGERQRVAIARSLINNPSLLLADEPTGNLDRATGDTILDMLCRLRAARALSMVVVTHDPHTAARADRVVRLVDGRVTDAQPLS